MTMYVIEFEVAGRMHFPLDMLRYDNCYPTRSEDAGRIGEALDREVRIADRDTTPIRLSHRASTRAWRPTEGRWESFGWHVVGQPNYTKL